MQSATCIASQHEVSNLQRLSERLAAGRRAGDINHVLPRRVWAPSIKILYTHMKRCEIPLAVVSSVSGKEVCRRAAR